MHLTVLTLAWSDSPVSPTSILFISPTQFRMFPAEEHELGTDITVSQAYLIFRLFCVKAFWFYEVSPSDCLNSI